MLNRTFIQMLTLLLLLVATLEARELPVLSGIGGDFSAVSTDGEELKWRQFKGRVVLLTFGYTNCADICPFTLGYLKNVYHALTPEQKKRTRVVFVTVDPDYDTPEHLKVYLVHFSPDFVGLTGSRAQIDRIVTLYQATYNTLAETELSNDHIRRPVPKKVVEGAPDTTILYSHSVHIFLIDKRGYTRGLAYTGTPKDQFVTDIQMLINQMLINQMLINE